jgi:cell division protein FtsB
MAFSKILGSIPTNAKLRLKLRELAREKAALQSDNKKLKAKVAGLEHQIEVLMGHANTANKKRSG